VDYSRAVVSAEIAEEKELRWEEKSGQTELASEVATPTESNVGDSPIPSSVS